MKKKRLSVSVAEDRKTPKAISGKVKPRNPIAANPLLSKAARHKTRKSRQGESRADIRQALRRAAKGGAGSDDWQNSSSATVVAVLPVITASDEDVQKIVSARSPLTLSFPQLLPQLLPKLLQHTYPFASVFERSVFAVRAG